MIDTIKSRYRRIPTFGRGTIRRFHHNALSMKRLAAHAYEDLLQASVTQIQSDKMILNDNLTIYNIVFWSSKDWSHIHNTMILNLLFDLATWHAFAKPWMHTNETLPLFEIATISLGHATRKFKCSTCSFYHTTELPHEYAAQGRHEAALAAKNPQPSMSTAKSSTRPKVKTLNLSTYKFHALGDYVSTIQQFGTMDSYSTQMVICAIKFIVVWNSHIYSKDELEHQCLKQHFPQTGKKKTAMVRSIANQEAIERFIHRVNTVWELLAIQANHSQRPARQ